MSKKYVASILEFIEYPDEPGKFNTSKKCIRNIPKCCPGVKVEMEQSFNGPTMNLISEDLDMLKKAWMLVVYADGEKYYNEIVQNGKLEDELKATDFYGSLNI